MSTFRLLAFRSSNSTPPARSSLLTYQDSHPALSQPDSLALALAKTQDHILLTGDRLLRDLAAAERVAHHGLLWALDEMADACVATHNQLCAGLRRIRAHPRCRLPEREVRKRLSRYCSHRPIPFVESPEKGE